MSPERSRAPLVNPLEESSDASLEEVNDDDEAIAPKEAEKQSLVNRTASHSYTRKLRRSVHRWHDRIPKLPVRFPRYAVVRTVKSSILVAKVCLRSSRPAAPSAQHYRRMNALR